MLSKTGIDMKLLPKLFESQEICGQVSEVGAVATGLRAGTPVVACAHRVLLRNPSNRELAETIGIRRPVEQIVYDLAIVGYILS